MKLVTYALLLLEFSSAIVTMDDAICTNDVVANNSADEYKYLYNYLTGTGAHNFSESVTIGFLGAYGQTQVVLGALPLAIEAVNNDTNLLPGRRLIYMAADIGTNPVSSGLARGKSSHAARAIRIMTQMRDNGTIAFIGPDDTCSSEALVAAAWNLPMISYKCSDTKVSDKRVFYTFARTLPPLSKISKSVVALLIAFKWQRFVVVSGQHPASGSEVPEAIKELSEAHGLVVTDTKHYSDYIPRHIDQMDLIVEDTYKRTRIYVFVGEHIALVDFVKCLQRRKLLDSGDYVVISVDDEIYDPNRRINIIQRDYLDPFLNETWGNVSDIMGFRSVLKLTPSHPRNPQYKKICDQIKSSSAKPPFCVPYHHKIFDSISVPIQAAYLYDAVMIYARALTEVFKNNEDPRNGTAILKRIVNSSYHSIQGHDVFIDANGDAEGNFTVVALLDDQEMNGTLRMSMQPVGYFHYIANGSNLPLSLSLPEFKYLDETKPIQWVGGRLPRAEPKCGFKGEKCIYRMDWRLVGAICSVTIVGLVGALFALKHYRYEQKLACLLWKIDMREVTIIPTETTETTTRNKSMIQVCRHSVFHAPTGSIAEISDTNPKRAYTRIGLYRGNIVAIKQLRKRSVDLTRSIRKELKQIREVRHENIIPFIGASVDHGHVAILTAYCARGSLEDVLANEDLHLDNMFVSSLVTDILKGMIYLHDSDIISHGNLRPSNCLIDSRWVLQITDFGLTEFKAGEDDPEMAEKNLRRSLWRAPELLRDPAPSPRGTQKGDIYSFAVVLYEIIGRAGPWGATEMTAAEIIVAVKGQGMGVPSFRPNLDALGAADYITRCIKVCWHEEPEQRPDIRYVRMMLKEMQAGLKPNIFDNMLAIMEKYAYNLEGLVQERTNQLTEEKKKTDALLHRMLPKSVAESLKKGERVQAETFDCVTIYFSDIVGFTELSAVSTPLQVINLLNDLYTCFDSIISHYDVYKVETIGDAYMVVSGLPIRNGDRHAGEIASMALHLLSKIKKFEIKHRSGELLHLRIGIHSGHCVAGVVGLKMPRYCLFGDTVNTASRMESSGESLRIHISHATYLLLQRIGGYHFEDRGLVQIKGKGEMQTFWLTGEDPVQRLARIRKEMLGSSMFSSVGSDHFNETPDLLRRPGNNLCNEPLVQSSCPLLQLHQRARRACSTLHLPQDDFYGSDNRMRKQLLKCMRQPHRGPSSAPSVSFQMDNGNI
ncbi:PREDICTED: guanylate cyclase 32E [Nicrophorus vespilloides]|uniref:Guanylate cyclase n=1 Tax=Nicrophorus vespilloides TaxID=110193 RepID=A0ABM1NE18_NICVS|nr:PREDICTED: guanylate cyclase 32E [Nicrophorus vespilloides]